MICSLVGRRLVSISLFCFGFFFFFYFFVLFFYPPLLKDDSGGLGSCGTEDVLPSSFVKITNCDLATLQRELSGPHTKVNAIVIFKHNAFYSTVGSCWDRCGESRKARSEPPSI